MNCSAPREAFAKKINQLHFSEEWMEEAQEVASKGDSKIQAFLKKFSLVVGGVTAAYEPLNEYKSNEIPPKNQFKIIKIRSSAIIRKEVRRLAGITIN